LGKALGMPVALVGATIPLRVVVVGSKRIVVGSQFPVVMVLVAGMLVT